MKNVYFALVFLFSLNINSQDSNLLGEWFLHTITANGNPPITTSPYNYNLIFTINSTNDNIYDNNGGMKCNAYWGSTTFPSPTILEMVFGGATLASCEPSKEGLYLSILTDVNNTGSMLHSYSITGADDNAILTLTNSTNNVLTYGRQILSNLTFTKEFTIQITQNPVQDELKVSTEYNDFKDLSYSIHSIEGKVIIEKELLNQNKINVSYLETGIYFLKVIEGVQQKTIKFIKK